MNNEENNIKTPDTEEEIKPDEVNQEESEELEELDEEEFTYSVDNNNVTNDYNRNYEKKSYIYIFVGFIILLIIIITLVALANNKTKKISGYPDVESRMVAAAKKYYEKYPDQLPNMENVPMSIDAEKLIQSSFLKPFSEMVKDNTECTGHVKVYKNDDIYSYFPYLNCGTAYKSTKLGDKLVEQNLVTDGDGLYRINDEYIFRGEYPHNYAKFNGETWRIMKINDDGSIKMIQLSKKATKNIWDDRYNNERNGNTGKNDFKISRMLDTLKSGYEENKYVKKENKELLVKKNWCIGKVSEGGANIADLNLCSETYDNLYIGLITIDEVLITSLDDTCNHIFDGSCTNYNYFDKINVGWTLTTGSKKTYTVFSANGATIDVKSASSMSVVRPVVNINADVLYNTGDGTKKNPYVIGK